MFKLSYIFNKTNGSTVESNHVFNFLLLLPPVLFLFILPFTHTVALRLTSLAIILVTCLWFWFRHQHPNLPLKPQLFLWGGLATASLLWTTHPDSSVKELKHEILYPIFAFFCFFLLTRSQRELKLFLHTLFIAAMSMALLAMYNYSYEDLRWGVDGRQGGIGSFTTYMLIILPWLVFYAITYKPKLTGKLLIAVLLVTILASIALTLSRIFWIALLAEACVLLGLAYYLNRRHVSKRIRLASILISTMVVVAILFSYLYINNQRFGGPQGKLLSSSVISIKNDLRPNIWQISIQQIKQSPWLGIGFGREITTKNPDSEIEGDLWPENLDHAHNMILNYAMQLGILGAAVLIILFAALIRLFFRYTHDNSREVKLIATCMLALIAGMIMRNMTDDLLRRDIALLFWSSMGMSLGYIYWQKFYNGETSTN